MRATAAALALLLGSTALSACSGDDDPAASPETSTPQTSSPPTSAPASEDTGDGGGAGNRDGNGDGAEQERQQPASPEVAGTVASGLEVPWGIDFLPGGHAVVTERDSARVLRLDPQTAETTELGTLPQVTPTSEGGLLGVAVSPDFADDRRLFLYLTTAEDNRVVSTELRGGSLQKTTEVLTGIPRGSNHDGGRLAFGPDGFLYVSTGEVYEAERAQDRDDLGGKILRITPEGDPASGNPFGSPVWSYGHRNVQGLAWVDDQLWASEFGADRFDELNRIESGGNHGWPRVEGRGGGPDLVDPQRVWGTGEASPSGLAYAEGSLWMAALRGNRLWQIPVGEESQETREPRDHFVGNHGRLRTVVVAPDDSLWVTTSNHDGRGDPAAEDDRILRVTLR